jgi:hypothetical protein
LHLSSSSSLPIFPPTQTLMFSRFSLGFCILLMKGVFSEIRVLEILVLFLLLMMMLRLL